MPSQAKDIRIESTERGIEVKAFSKKAKGFSYSTESIGKMGLIGRTQNTSTCFLSMGKATTRSGSW